MTQEKRNSVGLGLGCSDAPKALFQALGSYCIIPTVLSKDMLRLWSKHWYSVASHSLRLILAFSCTSLARDKQLIFAPPSSHRNSGL